MTDLVKLLSGRKTYTIAFALIAYVVLQSVNGEDIDPAVVNALLAGGLVTLRMGVGKAETAAREIETLEDTDDAA